MTDAALDGSGYVNITFDGPASVPEPSTWALLLGGLGALVYWRRRPLNGSSC
jgi:hypothetical protein